MLLTFTAILAVFISLSNGIPVQYGPLPGYDPNDSFCKDKSSGNYEYPAPHCDFFYSCSNALTYVMACGEGGLYYDKRTNRCEWPWKFPQWKRDECAGQINQTVQKEKDDASSGVISNLKNHDGPLPGYDPNDKFCWGKPNGNYEYPAPHCEFFYSCYDSHTYVMVCAERYLYYDRKTNACDYPWRFPQWKQDECEGKHLTTENISTTTTTIPTTTKELGEITTEAEVKTTEAFGEITTEAVETTEDM